MGKDLDPRFRPDPADEPAIRAICEQLVPVMREAAHEVGYGLGQHGSMVRDLDLIAAPWVAEAGDYDDLVSALHSSLKTHFGGGGVYVHKFNDIGPHGRRWANFYLQARHGVAGKAGVFPFIDLSIMPRYKDAPSVADCAAPPPPQAGEDQ